MTHEQLRERAATMAQLFPEFQRAVKGLAAFGYSAETIRHLVDQVLAGRAAVLALNPATQDDMKRFTAVTK